VPRADREGSRAELSEAGESGKLASSKDSKTFTAANRAAWDEAASIHAAQNMGKLRSAFAEPGYVSLDAHLTERLHEIGVADKRVAQLCCNNGEELISVRNMGASSCVGFDHSENFLSQARELAEIAGVSESVRFEAIDIYDIDAEYDDHFDIVLTTIGVFSWMPNLPAFFAVIARLLKPGGYLLSEEIHPVLMMYEESRTGGPSYVAYSYFKKEPWKDTDGLDYYGGSTYDAKPAYSFQHTMSDILMAGIDNGLTLRHMVELDFDISFFCRDLEASEAMPPLGFTMVMRKE
jgi:ubiquinone/menaquinone biosynthesis C-methylase UbiE